MAEVVLFHHVLGQTPGFQAFAAELGRHGHSIHTPDLFGGQTFPDIESGAAYAEKVGFDVLIDRGTGAVNRLPKRLVYAGLSLGVLPAQKLAQTRPGARGALLIDACIPATEFGDGWPDGVPVQIHGMDNDPFFAGEGDIDAARAVVEAAGATARAELFVYPGDQHLFTDGSLPSYDAEATSLLIERVIDFLDQVS